MKDFDFAGSYYGNDESVMTINDLHCVFNMPKALKTQLNEGKEVKQGLPPYAVRKAFKVDDYECSANWMHGSTLASSYFVPTLAEHGMWLDFNRNSNHKHHVAILISVQGINPLDGQSMVEEVISLKQYKTKCPKHDVEFQSDRFCPKCGYKWVPQNYLSTTGTPNGFLWLDGFLAADGVVRQYYFTEEEVKGVAHQIIGAEKKVYSIGVAFYLSKEPKPKPAYATGGGFVAANSYWGGAVLESVPMTYSYCCSSPKSESSRGLLRLRDTNDLESESQVNSLDIAAGAKIDQKVYADTNDLDFWQNEPAGMLYINYCPEEQAITILKRGKKDRDKGEEGFLAGLMVGK